MQPPYIDQDSFERWAQDSRLQAAILATRSALRVFPVISLSTFDLIAEDEADILIALRSLVASATTNAIPNAGLLFPSGYTSPFDYSEGPVKMAIIGAANSARLGVHLPVNAFESIMMSTHASALAAVSEARPDASAAAKRCAENDASTSQHTAEGADLFREPLWRSERIPHGVADCLEKLETYWDTHPQVWSFWRDWYQGFLDGKPLDWELQRRVALIPDADWDKGPVHIGKIIEEIRARFELERRIAELEAARARAAVAEARFGIGGNDPPEPLQDASAIVEPTAIIWAAVDELKHQAAAETPDKSRIGRIVEILSKGLLAILKWSGQKADLTVDTLIKWGVPIGAASLAADPDKLEAIIQAARAWLKVL